MVNPGEIVNVWESFVMARDSVATLMGILAVSWRMQYVFLLSFALLIVGIIWNQIVKGV